MCIAAAKLQKGSDDSENENMEGSLGKSSSKDGNNGAVEEDWMDEDEPTFGQMKCKKKILLSVDNVCAIIQSLF